MGRGKEGREDAVPSAKCSLNREKRTIVGKEGVKKKKKKSHCGFLFLQHHRH